MSCIHFKDFIENVFVRLEPNLLNILKLIE